MTQPTVPATYLEALEAAAEYNNELARHLTSQLEAVERRGEALAGKIQAERALPPRRIRKPRARPIQENL
jgi:hypothetical protein